MKSRKKSKPYKYHSSCSLNYGIDVFNKDITRHVNINTDAKNDGQGPRQTWGFVCVHSTLILHRTELVIGTIRSSLLLLISITFAYIKNQT